jgi:2-hydroxy-3-keto-5-methylthiopentenyl-1-phosphate phosphatase
MGLHFAVDFDGTVVLADTTDHVLERFANDVWLDVEREWIEGKIGSRECLAKQMALIDASTSDIEQCLSEVVMDPHFPEFLATARMRGATVEIVSDGFDRFITPFLSRLSDAIPVTCNHLSAVDERHWRAEFPHAISSCVALSGVCKCSTLKSDRVNVFIGDGRSDFCAAGRADFVLAKGKLAAYCRERGYRHQAISGFSDVVEWMTFQAHMTHDFHSEVSSIPSVE